jgi:hypothetical protein
MSAMSSATVRRDALEPQLDVVAIGEMEASVFYNPTPEPDSLVELFPLVVNQGCPQAIREFAGLLNRARSLNGEQTERAATVAGFLDMLAVSVKDAEINGAGARKMLAARALANALRPHLRVVADATAVDVKTLTALRAIDTLTAGIASAQILSPRVRKELGKAPFALLASIVVPEPVPSESSSGRAA